MRENYFLGCLLGTAVGDTIGLPAEGLSPERQTRLFGELKNHRLFFRWGFVSDDTAHAIMTAQALVASGGDPEKFTRALASRLRWWFLSLPPGVGMATARACLKLLIGISPDRSGVFSAGNGPAMRAPIIGLFCAHDQTDKRLHALIRTSTRITHTDPKAEEGALTIAKATSALLSSHGSWEEGAREEGARGEGISGYIVHTVEAALALTARHPDDLRTAVIETVALGGDTDTVAAIVGGILGARLGAEAVPEDWLRGIIEPWWTPKRLARLARQLAEVAQTSTPQRPDTNFWLPTHALLLPIVLFHGFRRLFPTY